MISYLSLTLCKYSNFFINIRANVVVDGDGDAQDVDDADDDAKTQTGIRGDQMMTGSFIIFASSLSKFC